VSKTANSHTNEQRFRTKIGIGNHRAKKRKEKKDIGAKRRKSPLKAHRKVGFIHQLGWEKKTTTNTCPVGIAVKRCPSA